MPEPPRWQTLPPGERATLMALAALHREFGAAALFETAAIDLIAGRATVAELAFLQLWRLVEFVPAEDGSTGWRLTGEGFEALPDSEERRALADHRIEADQALREE